MKERPTLAAVAEITILFLSLLYASYAFAAPVDGAAFGTWTFYLSYLPAAFGQAALVVLIARRPLLGTRGDRPPPPLRVRPADLGYGLGYGAALFLAYLALSPLLSTLGRGGPPFAIHPSWIPAALLAMLGTGYREEAFFRLYLHDRLEGLGAGRTARIAASTALFAAGHWGNGWAGVLSALVLGAILGLLYEARRSFHANAIGHGLYNAALIATAALSGGT